MIEPQPVEVRLVQWTMDMREGEVVRWLHSEGDSVQIGDDLVEIEAEKVTSMIEVPVTGTLTRILVAEGRIAEVGELLAIVEPLTR